ncbi:unnamed protein product [Schistocephalus solidus]|uniref:C3H1-type domain-containing protein n=1 Tax=Schistocephalus solidus TaxID=70667 RepID=A0A183TSL9_SCHSO|nr:unnamed protein product [Schistocephalus solidus]
MHSLNQGTTALLTQHPSATYLPLPSVATGFAGPNGRCCAAGSPGGPASPATAIALAAAMAASSGMPSTMKDSRWLTLEVCRQFQRKMCSRDENECKFAHPPPQVDVQNGRVICCYDSIKVRLCPNVCDFSPVSPVTHDSLSVFIFSTLSAYKPAFF